MFLDFRSTPDNMLHGSGQKINSIITLEIKKKQDVEGDIKCYIYTLKDGLITFLNGRFKSVGH